MESSSRMSKDEKHHTINSLLCLAKSLEKRYSTIDLRNEITVTGKIDDVDGYMNIELSDVAFYNSDGEYKYFPHMFIQSRNIRNIHIPDNVSITRTLKREIASQTQPPVSDKSGKLTFKESRAKRNQRETLKLVQEIKQKQLEKKEIKQEPDT